MSRVRKRLMTGLRRDLPFVPYAYKDQRGFAYIGRHVPIDKRLGALISHEESDVLMSCLLDRIEIRLEQDLPIVNQLTEARQAVVLDLAYVLGVNQLLSDRAFVELLNARKYLDVSDHILAMAWDPHVPYRASRLAAQMASGHWPEDLLTQHHEL